MEPTTKPTDSSAAWLQRFRSTGVLLDEPPPCPLSPTHECGVSLAWLQQFTTLVKKGGKDLDCTETLVKALVVPLAKSPKAGKVRLYDYCPVQHRGLPHFYIVHSWTDCLDRVVEQAVGYALATRPPVPAAAHVQGSPTYDDDLGQLTRPGLSKAAQEKQAGDQRVLESTYVWLDVCAITQHPSTSATAALLNLEDVRACVTAAQLGTLFVVDSELDVMQRCWCMYEAWASVYYASCERLIILFPDEMTLDDLMDFQEKCDVMELTRGLTSKPADKQRILAEVKHKVGLRRMQQLLPDSLMRSARAALRWSGDTAKVSMYCAMLLKLREWHQVQNVLHSIPELHDDEKMLQEIRDVFKMYDSDGSGELDQEEFVQVLKLAGFSEEESNDIFSLVDVDNGGSVSLEEFEAWWIESQRQQNTRHTKAVVLTTTALVTNLTAMVTLLERQGLKEHVPFYKAAITSLQLRPDMALVPMPVKGDWQAMSQQVAWKVSARDYRGPCKLMSGLLLWNAEALKTDPATLGNPDSTQGAIPLLKLLCTSMDQFGALLRANPATLREADYFHKAASELRDNVLEPLIERELEPKAESPNVLKKKPSRLSSMGLRCSTSSMGLRSPSPSPSSNLAPSMGMRSPSPLPSSVLAPSMGVRSPSPLPSSVLAPSIKSNSGPLRSLIVGQGLDPARPRRAATCSFSGVGQDDDVDDDDCDDDDVSVLKPEPTSLRRAPSSLASMLQLLDEADDEPKGQPGQLRQSRRSRTSSSMLLAMDNDDQPALKSAFSRSKSVGLGLCHVTSSRSGPPLPNNMRDSAGDGREDQAGSGQSSRAPKSKVKRQKSELIFPGKVDLKRDAVISDMVKLKYGTQSLVTPYQLIEAEKSLSTWTAAQKNVHGKGLHQSDRGVVEDFRCSYLNSGLGNSEPLPSLGGAKDHRRSTTATPEPTSTLSGSYSREWGRTEQGAVRGDRAQSVAPGLGREEAPLRRALSVLPHSSSSVSLPKLV